MRRVLAGRDSAIRRSTAFLGDARDDCRLGIGDVVLWRFMNRISPVQIFFNKNIYLSVPTVAMNLIVAFNFSFFSIYCIVSFFVLVNHYTAYSNLERV
jgi:hypothetical protein